LTNNVLLTVVVQYNGYLNQLRREIEIRTVTKFSKVKNYMSIETGLLKSRPSETFLTLSDILKNRSIPQNFILKTSGREY